MLIYLTQDAIPATPDTFARIVGALHGEPDIGVAYGRQLPHADAGLLGAQARRFNYPPVSRTKRLVDDDTIASVEWFLPSTDIEKSKESHDTSKAIVWITGGLAGTTYPILCRVTTAQGRIMDQSVNLKCAAK